MEAESPGEAAARCWEGDVTQRKDRTCRDGKKKRKGETRTAKAATCWTQARPSTEQIT